MKLKSEDHRLLVLWAADCAERVLPYFEKEQPGDDRPRKAIELGRDVAAKAAATGAAPCEIPFAEIRRGSLDSHAAARGCKKDSPACFAARAAGQAVATIHVQTHAPGAAWYALKVIKAVGGDVEKERDWQFKKLPRHLRAGGGGPSTLLSKPILL